MDVSKSVDSRSSLKFSKANESLTGTCQVKINGRDNEVIIDEQTAISNLSVNIHGHNNVIHVAGRNFLGHVKLFIRGHNSRIVIGSDSNLRSFSAAIGEGNSSISIGNECLFSIGIEIRTHDSHKIIALDSNERINLPESVVIGDRVWIGQDVLVLKGSQIGTDSVVGVRSVVTSTIPSNSVAVGVPARVVRSGIRWSK